MMRTIGGVEMSYLCIVSTGRPFPMGGRAHAVHADSLRIKVRTARGPDDDKARATTRQAIGGETKKNYY